MQNASHYRTLFRLIILVIVFGLTGIAQAQESGLIKYGQRVSREIKTVRDKVVLSFMGQQGDAITITIVRKSGELKPQVHLYAASGQDSLLGEGLLSSDGAKAALLVKLPRSALYTITVFALNDETTGMFELTLAGRSANPAGTKDPSTPEAADSDIEGVYSVTGTNPDSSSYKGTLKITRLGEDTKNLYNLSWEVGASYLGIGIVQGNVVSSAWGAQDCGIVGYKIQPDGKLIGDWIFTGQETLGTEDASPAKVGKDIAGAYTVSGKNPARTEYRGKLEISRDGDIWIFAWDIADSQYSGVGVQQEDTISVAWGEGCGVVSYIVDEDKNLDGLWAIPGDGRLGTEKTTSSAQ
jgi:hypothetical protein